MIQNTMNSQIAFPKIYASEKESNRPLWSVMIPTFNGAEFLAATLAGVLSQAFPPGEMQIEVLDDGSDDETEQIVEQVGKGRILFHRNIQRLGLVGNWNACLERANGHWVHILHQDDIVLDGFYSTMKAAIEANRVVGAAFCRYSYIDGNSNCLNLAGLERETVGILNNWLERIAVVQLIQFPSMVVKRSVYEKLGGFCIAAHYAADWEMWKRIARYYPVCYVPDMLAGYRLHTGSETSRLVNSGRNLADIRSSVTISKSYLPVESVEKWSSQALECCALRATADAREMLKDGKWRVGTLQVYEALHTSCSVRVLFSLFFVALAGFRAVLRSLHKHFKRS